MRGGQWQAFHLIEGLRERGEQCALLARRRGLLFEKASASGFRVEPVGLASLRRWKGWGDVIHTHDGRGHALAALSGLRPLVVSRRVAFPIRRGPGSKWKYARAGLFLAVSGFVRDRMLAAGIPDSKIRVVHDGVPERSVVEGGSQVVAPASEDPQKGSALLQQAARLARVDITFSPELERDLARAALFVYITRQEGLGSALLLAMAAGVPVIASRVGGIPEAVEHEVTGLLTENEPESIAASIRRLLDHPALAATLARRGRERARREFGLPRMVEATLSAYREVAKP